MLYLFVCTRDLAENRYPLFLGTLQWLCPDITRVDTRKGAGLCGARLTNKPALVETVDGLELAVEARCCAEVSEASSELMFALVGVALGGRVLDRSFRPLCERMKAAVES